jgi:Rrf2 family transcriptional regulator, cysteine metabolism repressor
VDVEDMKISSKGDYGLRALVDLATHGRSGQPVQVKDIARRQNMPEEYLGQLMVTLRRAGLVNSVRGASGGYLLARPTDQITVADVLESLEGSLALLDGLTERPERRAGVGPGLAIREVWWEATQAALAVLRTTTVHDLAEREALQAYTYQI